MFYKNKLIISLIFFSFLSVGRGCDEGYTDIDGECYYQGDLDVLQQFIDNSQDGENPPPFDLSPIELGYQVWNNGRLITFCCSPSDWNSNHFPGCQMDFELSGELPGNISDLTFISKLSLFQNQLSGEIPVNIDSLSNLIWLYLNENNLTGEIPESIGNITNLQRLRLGRNNLIGNIPESIGNLISLTYLQLRQNELTGSIPNSLSDLLSLKNLSLDNNLLDGNIPNDINNLTELDDLWVHGNQLSGIISNNICEIYTDEIDIRIYSNKLCPPYPECLTEEDIGYQDTSECEQECPDSIEGDINFDDIINVLDIVTLVTCIISDDECDECSDINYDGIVNVLDVVTLVNIILD